MEAKNNSIEVWSLPKIQQTFTTSIIISSSLGAEHTYSKRPNYSNQFRRGILNNEA